MSRIQPQVFINLLFFRSTDAFTHSHRCREFFCLSISHRNQREELGWLFKWPSCSKKKKWFISTYELEWLVKTSTVLPGEIFWIKFDIFLDSLSRDGHPKIEVSLSHLKILQSCTKLVRHFNICSLLPKISIVKDSALRMNTCKRYL